MPTPQTGHTDPGARQTRHCWVRPLLLVLVAAAGVAAWKLVAGLPPQWYTGNYNYRADVFGPAIGIAAGRGFLQPRFEDDPAMAAFLRQETEAYDVSAIPPELRWETPHSWEQRHRYLYHAVGWVWRITGVSWAGFKLAIGILFVLAMAMAYGMLRLVLPQWPAAAAALVYAWCIPTIELGNIRDFSKAPFLLAMMFVMAWLLRRSRGWKGYLVAAAAAGLAAGMGLGFRYDVMVALPPVLVALAACPLAGRRIAPVTRAAGLALCVGVFLGSAWPVYSAYDETGAPMHDIAMGLNPRSEGALGLSDPGYRRLGAMHDELVFATFSSYARRVLGAEEPFVYDGEESESAGRRFLLDCAGTFPGDALARGYAATLRVLWGPATAAMALLLAVLLMAWRPYLGMLCLGLILYFTSYPSLQYQPRHVYHLWLLPVAVWAVCGWGLWRAIKGRSTGAGENSPAQAWPSKKRITIAALTLAVLLLAPLWGLRFYQAGQVRELRAALVHAERRPLPATRHELDDWVIHRPPSPLDHTTGFPQAWVWPYADRYLSVDIEPGDTPVTLWLLYETSQPVKDLSAPEVIPASPHRVRHCFPIYECVGSIAQPGWSRFAGVAVARKDLHRFGGLSDLTQAEGIPLWLNATAALEGPPLPRWQSIQVSGGEPSYPPMPEPYQAMRIAWGGGPWDGETSTVDFLEEAQRRFPYLIQAGVLRAALLEEAGKTNAALEALESTFAEAGGFFAPYAEADRLLRGTGDKARRLAFWQGQTAALPGHAAPWVYLGRTQLDQGKPAQAARALARAKANGADGPRFQIEMAKAWAESMVAGEDEPGTAESLAQLHDIAREHPPYREEAAGVLVEAGVRLAQDGRLAEAREAFDLAGDWTEDLAERAGNAFRAHAAEAEKAGDWAWARQALELAMAWTPEEPWLLADLGVTLVNVGEINEGAVHLDRAVAIEPGTAGRVLQALLAPESPALASPAWRRVSELALRISGLAPGFEKVLFSRLLESAGAQAADGAHEPALERLDWLTEHGEASARVHWERGVCLQHLGRTAEGIAAWRAAIGIEPSNAGWLDDFARLLQSQEDAVRLNAWRALAREHPGALAIQVAYGRVLAEGGRMEEAREALAQAITLPTRQPVLIVQAAQHLARLGFHGDAAEAYRRAVQIMPQQGPALYPVLVRALLEDGRADQAAQWAARAEESGVSLPQDVLDRLGTELP